MTNSIKILVVEDEDPIRSILEYNLKMDGFDVYAASNGSAGLELAREITPDLILLDWMMPEMDGLTVLSQLKLDERTSNIPVFMLTAKGMMNEVGRALYEGADDYITKPFDPEELGQTLKKKLETMPQTKT